MEFGTWTDKEEEQGRRNAAELHTHRDNDDEDGDNDDGGDDDDDDDAYTDGSDNDDVSTEIITIATIYIINITSSYHLLWTACLVLSSLALMKLKANSNFKSCMYFIFYSQIYPTVPEEHLKMGCISKFYFHFTLKLDSTHKLYTFAVWKLNENKH